MIFERTKQQKIVDMCIKYDLPINYTSTINGTKENVITVISSAEATQTEKENVLNLLIEIIKE